MVEGACLENRCTATYRGFESLTHRKDQPMEAGVKPAFCVQAPSGKLAFRVAPECKKHRAAHAALLPSHLLCKGPRGERLRECAGCVSIRAQSRQGWRKKPRRASTIPPGRAQSGLHAKPCVNFQSLSDTMHLRHHSSGACKDLSLRINCGRNANYRQKGPKGYRGYCAF